MTFFVILFFIFCSSVDGTPVITSQTDTIEVINQTPYHVHQDTITFTQADLRTPTTFTFTDPLTGLSTGQSATPMLTDVYALYGKSLMGYVPSAAFLQRVKVCLTPAGVTSEMLNSVTTNPTAFSSQSIPNDHEQQWALESNTRIHPVVYDKYTHAKAHRPRIRAQTYDEDAFAADYHSNAVLAGTQSIGLAAFNAGYPGFAIIGSIVLPFALSAMMGGGGGNQDLNEFMRQTAKNLKLLNADIADIQGWEYQTTKTLNYTNIRLLNLEKSIQLTDAGFALVTTDIDLLMQNQNKEALFVTELARNTTANMVALQTQLNAASVVDQVLRNQTLAMLVQFAS